MGNKNPSKEMSIWTKDEYMKFSSKLDNPLALSAFEILYWCGLRLWELLALTKADIDVGNKSIRINKSYQRTKCEDVITDPKTQKSN